MKKDTSSILWIDFFLPSLKIFKILNQLLALKTAESTDNTADLFLKI